MKSVLHLEVSYDDDDGLWSVGAISTWADRIELARSHQCGPFTNRDDVGRFLRGMYDAWCSPALGCEPSESLHDAYAQHAP